MLTDVPTSLRLWFRVHAAVAVAAALPLLVEPARALGLLGWTCVDPVVTRLTGAALLGIAAAELAADGLGVAAYRVLLTLKVVWSLAAVAGLFVSIAGGAPPAAWALMSIFIALSGVWTSHAIRLRQLAHAPADHAGEGPGDDEGDGQGDAEVGEGQDGEGDPHG
jgi:hypothetical protein